MMNQATTSVKMHPVITSIREALYCRLGSFRAVTKPAHTVSNDAKYASMSYETVILGIGESKRIFLLLARSDVLEIT